MTYEVPYGVVREAVINAVAHRNYASKSGVQVMLFADRLEVWNPGGLPEDLTVDQLRTPHPSVPSNRLLCEPLFLAHYIERAGTGTLDMIRLCNKAGLPEPEFRDEGERFITVIWRDWLTDEVLSKYNLNDRQKKALVYLKIHGKISNTEYQQVANSIKKTATRDLNDLKEKRIISQVGSRGPGVHYVIVKKRDKMGTLGT